MEVKRRDRDTREGSRSPLRVARTVPPAVDAVLSLNRMAGNAAVVRILARQPPVVAPPPPKPIAVGAVGGGPIVFKTKAAKLGDVEVHFEGRLTVGGRASLEGDTEPEEKDLPDPANKNRAARVQKWGQGRVRDQLKAALDGLTPTGTGDVIELDFLGRKLKLELARGVAGLPEFVIHGEFAPPKGVDLTTGTVRIPKATFTLQATAVIKPAASKGPATVAPPDDSLVKKKGFTFDGVAAELDDRLVNPNKPDTTHRSGAVALFKSLKDMDALPDIVKNKWALSTTEKKLAFLVHMRSYFATDAETIEHFKKLRRVELHKKGSPTNLILHDEAATRLEAVRDELPAGSMPSTDIGWPRGTPSLHGRAGLYNLHDLGFAVDFNATETPNLTDVRQKDLILLVTGGQAWQAGGWREGEYAEMAKRTEQRAPMAEPDPKSDLGKQLAKVESEAKAASERSEAFRTSIDAKALLDLRTKRRKDKAAWAAADNEALAKVIEPWTKAVDADMAKNTKTLQAAGFDVASLKTGKALDEEKTAVSSAAAAAAAFRKGVKGDTLTDAQRKTVDALIAKLTGLVKPGAAAATAPATDADRLKVIDELAAAAGKRLGAYGAVTWRERVGRLQSSLKDAGWVLGDSDWDARNKRWQTQVVDPSPAQLADLGFFTLRDHSRSAPGGKAQAGAFDIPFVRAMAKHGFNQLSNSSTPVDSMHFELRWRGTKKK